MSVLEEFNGDVVYGGPSEKLPRGDIPFPSEKKGQDMGYREEAVAFVKHACQDMIDRINDIIPRDTKTAYSIKLSINIPTRSDDKYDLPNFEISMSAYPSRGIIEEFFMIESAEGEETN